MALDPNERNDQPIAKFESMLKTDDVYFFDAEDFEDIIHHYLNNGKISLAKKAIRIGLEQHPNAVELKLLEVEVLVFENHFEEAERILDSLQVIASQNEEVYIQRANIYSKKDNHEAAISFLEQALHLSEDNLDIYSLLGMEYLFMDDFQKAKENFMQCVEGDPDDYSSLYNVVYCFEFLEDFKGAISYLNLYLEGNPYCQVAWHQLGKQYSSLNMLDEALTAFDFAIISDDLFIGAYYEKGKVLEKLSRFKEAIENYKTTIEIEDPTSHAYLSLGRCYEALGNDKEAQYYYYQTVHEDPLLDKGWLAITKFYLRGQHFEKALDYINKAINIDGQNPVYWKYCALIHKALKQFDEADFAFKQAIDQGDFEADTWLQWAETVISNRDHETAMQILEQSMEFYADDPDFVHQVAGLYQIMADVDTAKKHLRSVLTNWPDQLKAFQTNFPELYRTFWAKELIKEVKRASE